LFSKLRLAILLADQAKKFERTQEKFEELSRSLTNEILMLRRFLLNTLNDSFYSVPDWLTTKRLPTDLEKMISIRILRLEGFRRR
jgi:hypothetical protein